MPTKILAIDDSKTMRLAIKITFAAEDAEVVAVSRGSEALARAKQMSADVILVDHSLATGEPSGFDVCKAIKADPETATMPVVLMVPAHGGVGAAEIQACGADASLRKPFETQDLIDTVARVVGQAVSRSASASVATAAAPTAVAPMARTPTSPPATSLAAEPAAATVARIQPRPPTSSAPVAAATSPNASESRTPAPAPLARPPASVAPSPVDGGTREAPAARSASGQIPIAVPIPFAPADSPSPGMLARLRAAAPAASVDGLDPQAVAALLKLSHEVIEQVVWEVVPDLAAEIIEQRAQEQLRAQAGGE